ncbi:hypothetical protein [Pseudanabaena sp. 'Roaring Creek']|uniref:hypothetical protein n=1 Tax=Pseudanabaena sp. 'Roaring Creek' TaxID=1681830 RepID=UPI0006D80BA2|nr:hypothetical protein [Pseudanabaena sp. 'Roaring Creek']
MRVIHSNSVQLNLIEETSIELKFQEGSPISARKAWMNSFFGSVFSMAVILFFFFPIGVMLFSKRGPQGDILDGGILNNLLSSPFRAIFIIVLLSFVSSLYASHFTLWVFDRLNREIRKTTTNISGKTKVIRTIPFDNVKLIDFEHHAADPDTNAFTELFITLKSGKSMTLSVSPSAVSGDKIMANQKHHEAMAKKMADCIWG